MLKTKLKILGPNGELSRESNPMQKLNSRIEAWGRVTAPNPCQEIKVSECGWLAVLFGLVRLVRPWINIELPVLGFSKKWFVIVYKKYSFPYYRVLLWLLCKWGAHFRIMAPWVVVLVTIRTVILSAGWMVRSRFSIPPFIILLLQIDHNVFYLFLAENLSLRCPF